MMYTLEEVRSLIDLCQEKDLAVLEVEGIRIESRSRLILPDFQEPKKKTPEEMEEEYDRNLFWSTDK